MVGLGSLTVLVVDDDSVMRELVRDVLKSLGMDKIILSPSAEDALQIFYKQQIDIIILDQRMDGMTGLEMTRHIRALPVEKNSYVSIIMLTGNYSVEHVVEARDAGVNEYLIKPFTVKNLCDRIVEVVDNSRDLVVSSQFKGPSRRRRSSANHAGTERRQNRIKPIEIKV